MKKLFSSYLLLFSFPLLAQPGIPDMSFGSGGKILGTQPSTSIESIIQLSDGKLLGLTQLQNPIPKYSLVKYFPNGSIDASFSSADSILPDEVFGVVVREQADSKIVGRLISSQSSCTIECYY